MNAHLNPLLLWPVICLLLQACTNGPHSYSDADDFREAYAAQSIVRQRQCLELVCIEARLQSASSITAREWKQGTLKNMDAFETRYSNLEGQLVFNLLISAKAGQPKNEPMAAWKAEHLSIRQGDRNIACNFLYDETIPGFHPGRSLNVVFDAETAITNDDFLLIIDHSAVGLTQFNYSPNELQNLPVFTPKSEQS